MKNQRTKEKTKVEREVCSEDEGLQPAFPRKKSSLKTAWWQGGYIQFQALLNKGFLVSSDEEKGAVDYTELF